MVPPTLFHSTPCSICNGEVEGQHGRGGGVDGHRSRDLIERNSLEESTHVVDRVDGDTDATYLALSLFGVGVVADLCGQIEGNGQSRRALLEQIAVPRVVTLRQMRSRRTASSSRDVFGTSLRRDPW